MEKEKETMHMLTQILGNYKPATAFQEPQWAHVMLDITTQGITTGLLHYEDKYFEININLLLHKITVIVDDQSKDLPLEDGTAIKDYYKAISTFLNDKGIHLSINNKLQEMDIKTPFEDDKDHHHYQPDIAVEVLKLKHRI
ncbi:DUF5996 family protein [Macrococcus armenti]|nr:DUF5996 family protein [Macrococcus armenti]